VLELRSHRVRVGDHAADVADDRRYDYRFHGDSVTVFKPAQKAFLFSQACFRILANTLPGPSASEVTTLWRYTNRFIVIVIIIVIAAVVVATASSP